MSSQNLTLQHKLHRIIFEADTKAGKIFDLTLIVSIVISVVVVLVGSIAEVHIRYQRELLLIEWFFTLLFSLEYLLRIYSVKRKWGYLLSFFGIIDLLSILPTYIALFLPGTHVLLIIRVMRVLRIFRILKLIKFIDESNRLLEALAESKRKIFVFLFFILTLITILGSFMYIIEGEENGFTSIPKSIYWAIVTMTTVGYGDISPQTALGQTLASFIMILGYATIALPTGLVTAHLHARKRISLNTHVCDSCSFDRHDDDAKYCKICGEKIVG